MAMLPSLVSSQSRRPATERTPQTMSNVPMRHWAWALTNDAGDRHRYETNRERGHGFDADALAELRGEGHQRRNAPEQPRDLVGLVAPLQRIDQVADAAQRHEQRAQQDEALVNHARIGVELTAGRL